MTGKVKIGKTFKGICRYVFREDKQALVLAADGVRTDNAAHMAQDFEYQRQMRPGLGSAVLHVALSLPAEEAMGRSKAEMSELLREIGQAYIDKMGLQGTQWALVQHFDRSHPHAHLIVNRVDNNGQVVDDAFIGKRSRQRCQVIEQEMGLRKAEQHGRDQAQEVGPTKRQQAAETPKEHRLAEWHRARHEAANVLQPLRQTAANWDELHQQAAQENVHLELKWYPTEEGTLRPGLLVEKNGFHFKGQEVGLEFQAGSLLEQLASNQQERQEAAVRAEEAAVLAEQTAALVQAFEVGQLDYTYQQQAQAAHEAVVKSAEKLAEPAAAPGRSAEIERPGLNKARGSELEM